MDGGGVRGRRQENLIAVWGLSRVRPQLGSALLIFRHEAGILSRV